MATLGYAPTLSLGGSRSIHAMLAAQAIVVTILYLSLIVSGIPTAIDSERKRLHRVMKAMAVRFFVTLAVAAYVVWWFKIEPAAFLIWIGLTYFVLVQVETWAMVTKRRSTERPS